MESYKENKAHADEKAINDASYFLQNMLLYNKNIL